MTRWCGTNFSLVSLQHYGCGKTELEAKVWYLTCVKQFPLYGCTLFPIVHKGLWSHTSDALLAINMDGIKFVRARDKSLIHDFRYAEVESVSIDANDNYVTLELRNRAQADCPQRTFMFETNHKEDIGHLVASYSPHHASWMKHDYEGMKKVTRCCWWSLFASILTPNSRSVWGVIKHSFIHSLFASRLSRAHILAIYGL